MLLRSPNCHQALFAVVESIIFVRNRRSVEDFRRVTEVELVSPEISSSFALIPFKEHRRNVYTYRYPVKMLSSERDGRKEFFLLGRDGLSHESGC
jgi:hypothetical protein